MIEAESGLGQNMKVVGNGVIYMHVKYQFNQSTVTCEMIELPLTAKCPFCTGSVLFSLRLHILTMKMNELAVDVFIRLVGLCLRFETA